MKLSFIFAEAFAGLRQNLSMVISVIMVTFVSLMFVGAAILLQMQISGMKDYWYDRVQVAIFLCSEDSESANCTQGEATEKQKNAIEAALHSEDLEPYVEKVYFEDKELAYELYQKQFSGTPLEGALTQEQMQESFRVKIADPQQYNIIDEYFSATEGVDDVVDQNQLLDQLFAIINVATIAAIVIAGIMLLCAALLIATTIRLSAFSRRRETGIMRLVGASNMVIQLPFVVEGVVAAVIGALLSSGVLALVVHFVLGEWASQYISGVNIVGMSEVFLTTPILVGLGIVLAAIASLLTLRRYLRV